MKKVLLTGFTPFGQNKINQSLESIRLVPDKIDSCLIIKKEINTKFYKSIEMVKNIFESENPDIIIARGLAVDRDIITIERIAININDADIIDNAGNMPVDEPIIEGGENAYFSNLGIKKIVEKLKENNFSASISDSAGTFVCNHLMYGILLF